jgi:hypothetical protein
MSPLLSDIVFDQPNKEVITSIRGLEAFYRFGKFMLRFPSLYEHLNF